jgi:hypothetical protein
MALCFWTDPAGLPASGKAQLMSLHGTRRYLLGQKALEMFFSTYDRGVE